MELGLEDSTTSFGSKELYHLFGLNPFIEKNLDFKRWQSMIHPEDLECFERFFTRCNKNQQRSQC